VAAIHGSGEELLAEGDGAEAADAVVGAAVALARTIGDAAPFRLLLR